MVADILDLVRVKSRTEELLTASRQTIYKQTDRLFAKLMVFQWLFGVAIAYIVSPRAWEGGASHIHIHVWAAIFLGAAIFVMPLIFSLWKPGAVYTRFSIAIGQMLYSGLLIHLTGGRIETHFHIFGSLAFLASYRDYRVLLVAAGVTALDHFVRGVFWPQSIFGVIAFHNWRWVEHSAWVIFEVSILVRMCHRSFTEMRHIAQDMAELELRNEQLNKAMSDLQQAQELEVINKKLKAMYELQKEFTSTVSHELRTPLASIKMGIDLVESKMLGEINAQQQEALGHVKSNVDRLKRLIDDILDLTKMESGRSQMNMIMNDLHKVIKEVIYAQSHVAESKGLYIKTKFDDQVSRVLFDSDRVIQVLNNLINNSIKFTKNGGITITTDTRAYEGYVLVSVSDTGKGIAPENISKLFQKFHQIESAQDNEAGGTGLGLAICKEIIAKHDGRIWVESKLGEGTNFNFILPIKSGGVSNE